MSKKIRSEKIAEQLHKHLLFCLKRQMRDPRISNVHITSVDLSEDLGTATVFFISMDDKDGAQLTALLEKAMPSIRQYIAAQMTTRYTPKIRFKYDSSIAYAKKIDDLLNDSPANLHDSNDDGAT